MNFAEAFLILDPSLVESKLRASMEKQISLVASGEMEGWAVLASNINLFRDLFFSFQMNLHRVLYLFTIEKRAKKTQIALLDFLN